MAQLSFASYRLQLVDFLPWMYFYEFGIDGRKPPEISSFLALIYPFDFLTWVFSLLSSIIMFLALITMQKLWCQSSREAYLAEYLYQGKKSM